MDKSADAPGTYVASDAASVNASYKSKAALKIVTYNIWFSLWRRNQRMKRLCEMWEALQPDVICLQEVTPITLQIILQQKWVREQYCVSDAAGQTVQP